MLAGIEAVIFDFDGTLAVLNIDFALMRERTIGILAKYGLSENEFKSRYVLEMIEEAEALLNGERSADAGEFIVEVNAAITEIETEASAKGSLIPGVKPMLTEIREKGYRIGIVSRNCEKAIKQVFPDIELHCEAFLPRDKVDKVKPDPEHLNKALGLLGVDGCQAAYVGDHLMDVRAGKRAGLCATVGVLTGRISEDEFKKAGANLVLRTAAHLTRHLPPVVSTKCENSMPRHVLPSPADTIR